MPAGTDTLPPQARSALGAYLAALDTALPSAVRGVYLGEIISKTAAAGYTARLLPRHAALLARAKAHRLGNDTARFTMADGHAACDLIEAVADHAAALRGKPRPAN